jgi:hypothetical protein
MWHDARIPALLKERFGSHFACVIESKGFHNCWPENQILRSSPRKGRLAESGSIHPAKGPLVVGLFRDAGRNAR